MRSCISPRLLKIESIIKSFGEKQAYRKNQILNAIYQQKLKEWKDFTSLPLQFRQALEKEFGQQQTLSIKTAQLHVTTNSLFLDHQQQPLTNSLSPFPPPQLASQTSYKSFI